MAQVKVESLQIRLSNENDTEKSYGIVCSISIINGSVGNVEGGAVIDGEGTHVANFSMWDNNLNINFIGLGVEQQVVVTEAINAFIAQATEYASSIVVDAKQ